MTSLPFGQSYLGYRWSNLSLRSGLLDGFTVPRMKL